MTTTAPLPSPPSTRLLSLDALRGFDMFWILGGEALIHDLARMWNVAPLRFLNGQFRHRRWEGMTFYDLIFPLFVFIVGVSIVFSVSKMLQTQGRARTIRRIILRSVLLYLFGILYYGGLSKHYQDVRLLGVLQRVALCYLFTALMFVFVSPRRMAIVAVVILL